VTSSKPVIVVGGGWAGLASAVELVQHNIPVILLESAKQVGGRARRVPFETGILPAQSIESQAADIAVTTEKISVDNGQHLLTGAYHSTLNVLQTLGVGEETVFMRQPLVLNVKRPRGPALTISPGPLPAPLHLAWGLLFAKGLSILDRIRALQFCFGLQQSRFLIPKDITCDELFKQYRQTKNIIKLLWEPLCIAALNTPTKTASASIFLRVLRETFAYTRRESDLLYTRVDLSGVFPDHAMDFIEKHGGTVRLGQRVSELIIDYKNNKPRLRGVRLHEGDIECQHLILATSHLAALKLLEPHGVFSTLTQQLMKLGSQPIVTIYLQFPESTTLNAPMIGFADSLSQWVFDRSVYGQHGLMAVVVSSSGSHMSMSNDELGDKVEQELAEFFPHWPKPSHRMIIREKRATFNCVRNSNDYRPQNRTSLEGVWLAGDYTDTQLPSTLEGAIRSGQQSAHSILKSIQQTSENTA